MVSGWPCCQGLDNPFVYTLVAGWDILGITGRITYHGNEKLEVISRSRNDMGDYDV